MAEESLRDLFGVSGKVVVVTGGGSGIGFMISQAFVKAGCTVYIASRKADVRNRMYSIYSIQVVAKAAKELNEQGPGRCVAFAVDVSTVDGCKKLAAEVGKQEDKVHVLVNNAGLTWGEPLEKFSDAGWDKVINLNVKSPFFLTVAFLPFLRKAATKVEELFGFF